ncbi:MAG TPA: pyridoxamine 5'-phosphate oxidase [Bacteroidales bacterium]|nr:pyridoxamine 5'-phosphate oxidase [Bacteroidales bacterium]
MDEISLVSEKTLPENPFVLFGVWYDRHLSDVKKIPDSMFLGTTSAKGRVSVRTVLLKDYDNTGFTFFTNYNSKKGLQIESHRNVALLFYWPESGRQVRIEGVAEKTSIEVSDAYFATRTRDSQLSAWASMQSKIITDRLHLEATFNLYKEKFSGLPVPRPEYWGGYKISPFLFEFWEDRENRLHDRVEYYLDKTRWIIRRLSP